MHRLGGYELAALMGAYTKAAELGLPVLLDGFIATTAALAAVHANVAIAPWLIATHRSAERGHDQLLETLGMEPVLDVGMRLGEASGAAAAVPLMRTACTIHREMATFGSAGISSE
jgi:NaMN:DMB phosphoribosyltransferase